MDEDGFLEQKCINITPKEFSVKSGTAQELVLTFKPKCRISYFEKYIKFKILNINKIKPFILLNGMCQGTDITLYEKSLYFDNVVFGSSLTKHLTIENKGDTHVKFKWDWTEATGSGLKDFTIGPKEGILNIKESLNFNVTFKPQKIKNQITLNNLKCNIEGNYL